MYDPYPQVYFVHVFLHGTNIDVDVFFVVFFSRASSSGQENYLET